MLVQRLRSLSRAGVLQISRRGAASKGDPKRLAASVAPEAARAQAASTAPPVPSAAAAEDETAGSKPARPIRSKAAPRSLFEPTAGPQPNLSLPQRHEALQVVQEKVARCVRCEDLVAARTQTVFGVGNPQARLCFLGEAPGADEDRLGEPFVGRAGQLLTKIIEACTLRREDVYILNVLKCRPPGNRTPSPEEAANCREYLDRQLDIIRPEFICCLGAVAAQALLETTHSIGRLRGRLHDYRGVPVAVTYHPAYLLRNPSAKKLVWEDMQSLMRRMGIELPERRGR
jgi:DNA polymerase